MATRNLKNSTKIKEEYTVRTLLIDLKKKDKIKKEKPKKERSKRSESKRERHMVRKVRATGEDLGEVGERYA